MRLSVGAAVAAAIGREAPAAEKDKPKLPTVKWGKVEISRLLVGHNPLKGLSYTSRALDQEMRSWYDPKEGNDVKLLERCQAVGINTAQLGRAHMETLLRKFYAAGGKMQWIPTFHSRPGKGAAAEMKRILKMRPKPIGFQQFGAVTDKMLAAGNLDQIKENLKLMRDTGLLVGLGAHDPRVIEHAEEKGWDVDFYECCFYKRLRGKVWPEEDRQRMTALIRKVSKPCIAYKVLAANRLTKTPQDVYNALKFTFDNIKPTDVVLLGMWQKHTDQVGQNATFARKILAGR